MTMDQGDTLLMEIDEAHHTAQTAFQARNLKGYMAAFTLDLAYKQLDGTTIGRDALRKDVARQFDRVSAVSSQFARESFQANGTEVSEALRQSVWFATTAFGILHRVWRLERRGLYTWRRGSQGWQIAAVEVFSERLVGAGFQIARRARLPASGQVPVDAA